MAPGGTEAPERVTPRNTETPTAQEKIWYQQVVDQTLDSSLMHRYGTLEEQAQAILFLASDQASYITGVTLPVAGATWAEFILAIRLAGRMALFSCHVFPDTHEFR